MSSSWGMGEREGGRGLAEAELLRNSGSLTEPITGRVSRQLNAGWRDNAGYNASLSHKLILRLLTPSESLFPNNLFPTLTLFFKVSKPSIFCPSAKKMFYFLCISTPYKPFVRCIRSFSNLKELYYHCCIVVHINVLQQLNIFCSWMNKPSDDSSRRIIPVQIWELLHTF